MIELSDIRKYSSSEGQLRQYLKTSLKNAKQILKTQFEAGTPARQLVHTHSDIIDQLLHEVWNIIFTEHEQRMALVAVGGYGRAELHPGSDIDLSILIDTEQPEYAPLIERFITLLWDIGLEVGHSVRTIEQCISASRNEITVATNLMEARFLFGNKSLFDEMKTVTGPKNIWPVNEFFEAKWKEQIARHHKYHDTSYNLEPNIKEGPGGLRDIQMIAWVAKRHFDATTLHDLVTHNFLTEKEFQELDEGQDFLWKIRYGLHLITGRHEDRLSFDHQRTLAKMFGYQDSGSHLAVEIFMKQYYRTIMRLNRLNEMLLQLFEEAILLAHETDEPVKLNSRFQNRHGFIEVTHDNIFKKYPFALLEVFFLLQQHTDIKGVRASTIRLIRAHTSLIDDKFRNDLRCRSLFMEIIRQPEGITNELRRMNRYGVLAAYLPVFGSIVGQMQHDLFHVYTVDEHTLFVVRNLRRFSLPEYSHEFPMCSEIMERLPKPEILYLAGLFHDIAKGRGGDHSELGAVDARAFCLHHGMSEYDAELTAWLVQNHLIMSQTSQKKDISDPIVVRQFSQKIQSTGRLDYLYLLTVADIRATNASLWNSWKAALLMELYSSCKKMLEHGHEIIEPDKLIESKRTQAMTALQGSGHSKDAINLLWQTLDDDYFSQYNVNDIVWHAETLTGNNRTDNSIIAIRYHEERGGTEIFVHTTDSKTLFAAITYTLARFGLDVVDARIYTSNSNETFDTYTVLEENGQAISSRHRINEIKDALLEQISSSVMETGKLSRQLPRQLKYFRIPTKITFTKDAANRTVMEVVTTDQPGLLSRIAMALSECRVNLRNARVTTFGERVEDTFLISDENDSPDIAPETLEHLQKKIVEYIEST